MTLVHFKKYLMAAVSSMIIASTSVAYALPFSSSSNNNTNVNTNVNVNADVNTNFNLQNQRVDVNNKNNLNQWQGQGQDQRQSNTNVIRGNGDRNDVRVTTAPNLAGLVASPHTCMGSVTVSGGGGGLVSLGVGSTYRDRECDLREAIKLAAQLGLSEEAVRLFYQLDAVRSLNGGGVNRDQNVSAGEQVLGEESGTNTPRLTLVEWFQGKR